MSTAFPSDAVAYLREACESAESSPFTTSISVMPNSFIIDMVATASKIQITERRIITYDEVLREQDWNVLSAAMSDMAINLSSRGAVGDQTRA